MYIRRLERGQAELAKALFSLLSRVLDEGEKELSGEYIDRLLRQDTFWAVAAFDGDCVVGGLTAHVLPMTKAEYSELLIYDVAVETSRQRHGIGHVLMSWVVREAFALGIRAVFVLAENVDVDAVRFYQKLDGHASLVTLFAWNDERVQLHQGQ